jgi:hypothetical protein
MANYYFLATLLPPLRVGSPVELGSKELSFLLEQNLTKEDLETVNVLKRFVDVENIRAIWQKQPFLPGGTLEKYELEERLFFQEGLPQYVLDYLEHYPNKEERIANYPKLLHQYFAVESKNKNPFIQRYLRFQWYSRLVFVAIRAQALGRNIEEELKYEDPEDPFVQELLQASQEKHFEAPAPFTGLMGLYESRKEAPLDLYQAFAEWEFAYIAETIEWEFFSLERILGYVAQLKICEEWLQLDKLKGVEIAREMMEPA